MPTLSHPSDTLWLPPCHPDSQVTRMHRFAAMSHRQLETKDLGREGMERASPLKLDGRWCPYSHIAIFDSASLVIRDPNSAQIPPLPQSNRPHTIQSLFSLIPLNITGSSFTLVAMIEYWLRFWAMAGTWSHKLARSFSVSCLIFQCGVMA